MESASIQAFIERRAIVNSGGTTKSSHRPQVFEGDRPRPGRVDPGRFHRVDRGGQVGVALPFAEPGWFARAPPRSGPEGERPRDPRGP